MDMKLTAVMAVVSILLVVSIVQSFQLNNISNKISATGAVTAQAGNGAIDTAGWTENEIMNYEMHGTIPARAGGGSSAGGSSGLGMVGGC